MKRGDVFIEMKGISKRFPGVRALDSVDLTLRTGEVHALTGENGSGKSTLARVLAGLTHSDAGQILLDGQPVQFQNPADAIAKGIVMISQELTLAPTLTVAENIFLGRLPRSRLGLVDWPRLQREAIAALDRLDVHVPPHTRVSDLTVELRQEVEIARALSTGARLIILDEATSSLSEAATTRLLSLIAKERDKGTAVLMITHRMPEIYAVSSVATVLRDGLLVAEVPLPQTGAGELVRLMVGREIGDFYGKRSIEAGATVLEVEGLSTPDGALQPASFSLRQGEILGVAGLVGSGKAELGQALGGAIPCTGTVRVKGKPVALGEPRRAINAGIGFVPDDRKGAALMLVRSVRENFALGWLDRLSRYGLLNTRAEARDVAAAMKDYSVAASSASVPISTLSGGNQQKVVLGRSFTRAPSVLVLSEPTRGIDVGAKAEIYRLLQDAAAAGAGVMMISSELPELLGVADRIAVFFQGELRGIFDAATSDEEMLAHVAVAGQLPDSPQPKDGGPA